MPTPTLMKTCMFMSWCHGGVGTVIHPDKAIMKFTIPSLVNPTSSVHRMFATNYVFTMHFGRSHWKYTILARWSEKWGLALTGCGRNKVILTKDSPDKWNTRTFSRCSSSHTGSGIFSHSSQYINFHIGNSKWSWPSMIDTRGTKDWDLLSYQRNFEV